MRALLTSVAGPPKKQRKAPTAGVADVKSFLNEQAQQARKIEELERELRAEKQKTREAEQEAAQWKRAYGGLKTERDDYVKRTQDM